MQSSAFSILALTAASFCLASSALAQSVFSKTGDLKEPREGHTANLLPDGKVLAVGGWNPFKSLATAEVYDPEQGTWSQTAALQTARTYHTATLLGDGKILVTGGQLLGKRQDDILSSSELYDPATGVWTPTGALHEARFRHAATLLPDGKVLVVGGTTVKGRFLSSAEIYDPATGQWRETGRLPLAPSFSITTHLLQNGLVLAVEGAGHDMRASFPPPSKTDLYDPATGSWRTAGSLKTSLTYHSSSLLPNGNVFVATGVESVSNKPLRSELYDAKTGAWSEVGPVNKGRAFSTATMLPDGTVLLVGGVYSTRRTDHPRDAIIPINELAKICVPASGTWSPAGIPAVHRSLHTATLLQNGKVLLVGGKGAGQVTELYDAVAAGHGSPP